MQSYYLRMYLNGKLIDEVPLNYSGLQSLEEKEWYHKGAISSLCERHEILLHLAGTPPDFLISSDEEQADHMFVPKRSGEATIFL